MATTQVGPLTVIASCTPDVALPDMGLVLRCGGMLRNGGSHALWVQAQTQPCGCQGAPGAAVGVPITTLEQTLQPQASMTLPAPATGQQWVIVFAARRNLEDIGLAVLGGGLVVLGLAGVGLVDVVKWAAGGRKRRRR